MKNPKDNPLGKEVTLLSAVMLNIGQITGYLTVDNGLDFIHAKVTDASRSGIYAVPGVILNSVGSIGMLFLYWILGPLFAFGLSYISYSTPKADVYFEFSWTGTLQRIRVNVPK